MWMCSGVCLLEATRTLFGGWLSLKCTDEFVVYSLSYWLVCLCCSLLSLVLLWHPWAALLACPSSVETSPWPRELNLASPFPVPSTVFSTITELCFNSKYVFRHPPFLGKSLLMYSINLNTRIFIFVGIITISSPYNSVFDSRSVNCGC